MPPGRKPKPPGEAVNRNAKAHPYREAPAASWQHGDVPEPPDGLHEDTVAAWHDWFASWWSSFWTPADLPVLREIVKDFDQVVRGRLDLAKITAQLDRYGITPKGRVDLRWAEPAAKKPAQKPAGGRPRLQVVDSA